MTAATAFCSALVSDSRAAASSFSIASFCPRPCDAIAVRLRPRLTCFGDASLALGFDGLGRRGLLGFGQLWHRPEYHPPWPTAARIAAARLSTLSQFGPGSIRSKLGRPQFGVRIRNLADSCSGESDPTPVTQLVQPSPSSPMQVFLSRKQLAASALATCFCAADM